MRMPERPGGLKCGRSREVRTSCLVIVLVTFNVVLSACSSQSETTSYGTTIGKEFIDLQRAHEAGAISDREYKDAKEKLLDSSRFH